MTEELIREARAFAALGSDLNPVEANRLIFELADELAAAGATPQERDKQHVRTVLDENSIEFHHPAYGVGLFTTDADSIAETLAAPVQVDEAKLAEVARAAAEKALVEFADGYERAAEYAKDERSKTEPDSSYWDGADDVVEHVIASLRTKASTYRRNEGENDA